MPARTAKTGTAEAVVAEAGNGEGQGSDALVAVRLLLEPGGAREADGGVAVNVDQVSEIRRRANGWEWELKLEPPVNRIVPVARDRVREVWAAYGE